MTKPGPEQDSVRTRWLQSTGRSSSCMLQTPFPSYMPCPYSKGSARRATHVSSISACLFFYTQPMHMCSTKL